MLLKPKYQIALAGFCLVIVAISGLMIGNTLVSPMTLIQALFNLIARMSYTTLLLEHEPLEQSLHCLLVLH